MWVWVCVGVGVGVGGCVCVCVGLVGGGVFLKMFGRGAWTAS